MLSIRVSGGQHYEWCWLELRAIPIMGTDLCAVEGADWLEIVMTHHLANWCIDKYFIRLELKLALPT